MGQCVRMLLMQVNLSLWSQNLSHYSGTGGWPSSVPVSLAGKQWVPCSERSKEKS